MPVLVGSLGRVPVGALTDRYGGRVMFTVLTLASAIPVLLVAFAGSLKSYPLLLVFGFFSWSWLARHSPSASRS